MKSQLTQTLIIVFIALAFAYAGPAYGHIFTLALMLLMGGFTGAGATGLALAGHGTFAVLAPCSVFTGFALLASSPGMARPICFAMLLGVLVGSAALLLACYLPIGEDEDT
jgi:hypothetical protein